MDPNATFDSEDLHYFSDVRAREEELLRLNEELDLQLDKAEMELESESKSFKAVPLMPRGGASRPSCSPSASSHGSKGNCVVTGMDENEPPLMGTEATIRIQRAKIKALSAQLKDALHAKREVEDQVSALKAKAKDEANAKKRLSKSLTEAKSVALRIKSDDKSSKELLEDAKMELRQVKAELTSAQKLLKAAESEHRGREVRLSRALEECSKYKNKLAENAKSSKEGSSDIKKERDMLLTKIKSLERQRQELLLAFKKQLKLIDILKRQKVHAEASKLLSFREEEFCKIIGWGA